MQGGQAHGDCVLAIKITRCCNGTLSTVQGMRPVTADSMEWTITVISCVMMVCRILTCVVSQNIETFRPLEISNLTVKTIIYARPCSLALQSSQHVTTEKTLSTQHDKVKVQVALGVKCTK